VALTTDQKEISQRTYFDELPILFKSNKFAEVSHLYCNFLLENRHYLKDDNWSSQIQYIHPLSHYIQSKESWKVLDCCIHEVGMTKNDVVLNVGSGSGYLERLFREHDMWVLASDYESDIDDGLDGVRAFAPLRHYFGTGLDYKTTNIHDDDFKIYNGAGTCKQTFDWIIMARFLNHSYLEGKILDLEHILMCLEKLGKFGKNFLISGMVEVNILRKGQFINLKSTIRGQLYGNFEDFIPELKSKIESMSENID
jgi:hypothetical protein|tara:strand:- start:331 stop:1092 length:762 start_codon:yes stop_codon:yes gene_type:complete